MISEKKLIEALIDKQNSEHPVYDDISGSMTYFEIIEFIKEFAKDNKLDD